MQPRTKSIQCLSPCGPHTMFYKEWGDERNPDALICVHGLTRTSDDFDVLAETLCARYRILCPDIAGRGRSSWLLDPGYYVLPTYVNDLLNLLVHAQVRSVAWLGTSMGGLIGMSIAAAHPALIKKLILNDIGPALSPIALSRIGSYVGQQPEFATFEEAAAYVRQISASFGPHDDEQWIRLAKNVLRQNRNGKWIRNHDPAIAKAFQSQTEIGRIHSERMLWATYDAVRCPTLVIRGTESDLLTYGTALEMTQRGPKATLVELAGIGHAPMFMHAGQVDVVAEFLNS